MINSKNQLLFSNIISEIVLMYYVLMLFLYVAQIRNESEQQISDRNISIELFKNFLNIEKKIQKFQNFKNFKNFKNDLNIYSTKFLAISLFLSYYTLFY